MRYFTTFAILLLGTILVACLPPKTDYRKVDQLEDFESSKKDCETRNWPCSIFYDGSDDDFDYFTISKMNYILPGDTNERFAVKRGYLPLEKRFQFDRSGKNRILYSRSR